ncbi:MAG: hypothetical protein IPO40_20345 [Fibrobacteres bacterium]|nr:hypothetical protein [Fibrobacterota bacterium]
MTEQRRDAVSTIRGYNYQFDSTILMLLQMTDEQEITIEGVEDFDVASTNDVSEYYQCKYYSSERLTNAVIRDGILPMLIGFKSKDKPRGLSRKYHLYGYFKDSSPHTRQLTLQELKECLVRKEKQPSLDGASVKQNIVDIQSEMGISDPELLEFSNKLHIHVCDDYETNNQMTITELARALSVGIEEAKSYLYPSAFSFVAKKATNESLNSRKVKRREFLSEIKPTKAIISTWLLRMLGDSKYCASIKAQYFSPRNVEPDDRIFVIDCHASEDNSEILSCIYHIRKKWSSHASRRKPNSERYAPFIFLRNARSEQLIALKRQIATDNIQFVDGYQFQGAEFSINHILTPQSYENQISLRFLNSMEDLFLVLNSPGRPKLVYEFLIESESGNYPDGLRVVSVATKSIASIKSMT